MAACRQELEQRVFNALRQHQRALRCRMLFDPQKSYQVLLELTNDCLRILAEDPETPWQIATLEDTAEHCKRAFTAPLHERFTVTVFERWVRSFTFNGVTITRSGTRSVSCQLTYQCTEPSPRFMARLFAEPPLPPSMLFASVSPQGAVFYNPHASFDPAVWRRMEQMLVASYRLVAARFDTREEEAEVS